jgi:ribosomal-protein-alanine N-acetyltransferase
METLKIETSRLIIRNLKASDVDDFHLYRSNPEITKYQSFEPMTRERTVDFIDSQKEKLFGNPGEWVQYGLENKQTGKIVGDCAVKLDADDPRIAEIGITISHLEQQKGYAKETMLGLLKFLFEEKQIHRVVETVDAENTGSINLLKSVGFRFEAHFVENIFFKGKWGSEFVYAMLKREWDAR